MDYVNISTAKFEVGDRIKYIDPGNPSIQHLVEIKKISDENENTVTVLLDVFVVATTDENTHPGDEFSLTIDRAGSPLLGIIIRKGTPLAAYDDFLERKDLVIYYLVAMLKNQKRKKSQASYSEIYQYLLGLGILGDLNQEKALKDIILPAIKLRKDLFKSLPGGHIRYLGGDIVRQKTKGVVNNNLRATKVVDVSLIVKGFSEFLVNVLKSGLLGDVEIKYD